MDIKVVLMVIASLALVISIALFFVFPLDFYKGLIFIMNNNPENGIRGKVSLGESILFTGAVNENNTPLVNNFIIAQDLEYYGGEDSGWSWIKDYKQEFNVTCGSREIRIIPLFVKFAGKCDEVINPEDKNKKTAGFIKGSVITVQGKVVSESPLKVEVSSMFAGEEESYVKYLKKFSIISSIIPVMAVVFAVFFFLGVLMALIKK